jgi:hypothetical protein
MIYFPFFLIFKEGKIRSGYFCGGIKEEENKLVISLNTTEYLDNLIYLSFVSPESVSIDFLESCIQKCKSSENINAIIVEHYVAEQLYRAPDEKVNDYIHIILIYKKSDVDTKGEFFLNYLYGISNKTNERYHIFILSNDRFTHKKNIKSQQSINLKIIESVIIKRKGKEVSTSQISVEIRESYSVKINEIKTWPLTVHVPLNIITTYDLGSIIKDVKIQSLEALIGSLIFIKESKSKPPRQLQLLIPTSLLSSLSHMRMKYDSKGGEPIDVQALPSASYIDIGGIVIKVNLENLFKRLVCYIIDKLNKANEILNKYNKSETFVRLHHYSDWMLSGVCRDVGTLGDDDVYSEAIFKTLVNNFIIVRTHSLIESKNINIESMREKLSLPHRIRRVDIPISAQNLELDRLGLPTRDKDIYIAYEVVRGRTRYLRNILSNFGKLKNEGFGNYGVTELLLASFILFINDIVRELYKKDDHAKKDKIISIKAPVLAYRMALLLLELGLHALSHILYKYITTMTKVPSSSLRENIVLFINRDNKYIRNAFISDYYLDVIINGFIYRIASNLGSETNRDINGLVMISDIRPYTYGKWSNLVMNFDLDSFINFSLNQLGNNRNYDKCLILWGNESKKLEAYIRLYTGGMLLELKNSFEESFGLGDPNKGYLTLPLLDIRPLIDSIISEKHKNTNVREYIRPHMEALYISSIPFCFDGCYNCVLIDKGCNSNPISKEWSVSKSIARLIIKELKKT